MMASSDQMQFLSHLVYMLQAKKTLDIGTYTGYSALTIGNVLPADGKVYAIDITNEYLQEFCKPAWEMDKVSTKIKFICKSALEALDELLLLEENKDSFDFAFIDADKLNYLDYYEKALSLLRPGGLIAIDNVSLYLIEYIFATDIVEFEGS
ncbi:Catechol O-methyltransferase domain-containing protein 1 [Cichlidogyrus casuarinus]|uniref:Catechol O-methyltransferase domain-containing protein 1 n=1 Tax=Cichlidogyrus casuarinus TaxID=1844966 RepID=A0ABD2QHA0_9PLAT